MYKYDRLPDDHYAYMFVFSTAEGEYRGRVGAAILQAMQDINYTETCEYYAGKCYWIDDYYRVGIGLGRNPKVESAWEDYNLFYKRIASICDIDRLIEIYSELTYLSSVRAWLPIRGMIDVKNGLPQNITHSEDSYFLSEVKRSMEEKND